MKFESMDVICGFLVLALIGLIIIGGQQLYYNHYYENPCLERVAKEVCINNNMFFDKLDWMLGLGFYCKIDIHKVSGERFIFTKGELKSCGE